MLPVARQAAPDDERARQRGEEHDYRGQQNHQARQGGAPGSAAAGAASKVAAARRLEPLDAALARETYVDALASALTAGCLAEGGDLRQIAEAARAAPPAPAAARPIDLLLDGLAVHFTEGYVASLPLLRSALEAFGEGHSRSSDELRSLGLGATPVLPAFHPRFVIADLAPAPPPEAIATERRRLGDPGLLLLFFGTVRPGVTSRAERGRFRGERAHEERPIPTGYGPVRAKIPAAARP